MAMAPPPPLTWFFGAAATYGLLFLAVRFLVPLPATWQPKERLDGHTRLVSYLNVVFCLGASWRLLNDPGTHTAFFDLEQAAFGSTELRDISLLVVSGYMLYDLVILLSFWRQLADPSMLAHHLVVGTALVLGVQFRAATFYMAVLCINELSTLFLNARYFLLFSGRQDTTLYLVNGLALVVSFFVFRVLTISVLVAHALYSWWDLAFVQGFFWKRPPSTRILFACLTLLLLAHYALNLVWFSKIWSHGARALSRHAKATDPRGVNGKAPRRVRTKGD